MNAMRNNRCDDIIERIMEIDFAIYETALYLDAYPECKEALNHYHALMKTRRELYATYEATIGPMTIFGNESKTSWDWTKTPMPWENK